MDQLTALLDGDSFVYLAALAAETDDWEGNRVLDVEAGISHLDTSIQEILYRLQPDRVILALSQNAQWRYDVLPSYKANRGEKPAAYHAILEYTLSTYETWQYEGLEGDDVLGILSTHPTLLEGRKVIVSVDKDMRTIPGLLYNPKRDTLDCIGQEEADRAFYMQCLTGDPADGYKGVPGIGPKRAEKILGPFFEELEFRRDALWDAIVKTYESKGLTEEDALQNARVARICRCEDFDVDNNLVRLWTP